MGAYKNFCLIQNICYRESAEYIVFNVKLAFEKKFESFN